jgi:putative ABC transport system permease protein
MHRLGHELRQAWRSLLHRQAYFLTCVATLTLVLGANSSTFAVVNATLLRPMPFATRGPVVQLFSQPPGTTAASQRNPLQQMEVPRLRERARTLARLEGFLLSERVVTLGGEPGVAQTAAVTPGLLPMMAAPIAQGRSFLPGEGDPGHFVAIVADRYWRDVLGSAGVIGTALVIDGQPHTIVGILSPAFAVPFLDAVVFTPLVARAEPQPRAPPRSVVGLAEVAPGASLAAVRDELEAISAQFAAEFPRTHVGWTLGAQFVRDWQYGSLRAPLVMLLVAAAFVLLIACVNIANLASAQALGRRGEMSLRIALGASSGDLLRLHAAELLIVCACGLIPGLVLAWFAVPALLAINPTIARSLGDVGIDWRVLTFSALAAMLTAVIAASVPAIRAVRGQISRALAGGTRTTRSPRAVRLQRLLVSLEVALCLALLMAGAVVVQGLRDLSRRGPGYDATSVLTAQIRLPDQPYQAPELRALVVQRMLDDIRTLPGVVSASTVQNPFVPGFSYQTLIRVKDVPTPDDQPHTVQFRRVSTDYFRTLRINGVAGRAFTDEDVAAAPAVAIVSKRFAEALLPGIDPIGRTLLRVNPPPLTIVGVVDDVSDVSVAAAPEATIYLPWAQNNNSGVPITFVIRTAVDPASLASPVRDVVKRIDASLPLRRVQPLEAFVSESTAPERFRTIVLGIIAMLGLVLAAVGISGVTSRSVIDRSREFAVRLALGSHAAGIIRLVLVESARDLAVGALAGVVSGVALCLLLTRVLDHVGAPGAVTTGLSIAVIVGVGLIAAFIPALRLRRVQPAQVLRS